MKVVTSLTSTLSVGHHVYFDNYFSSIPLLQSLLDHRIYSCGTFRKDRIGIPDVIKKLGERKHKINLPSCTCNIGDLEQGDFVFRQCDNIVVTAWKDKRLVYVMSTNVNATDTITVKRNKDKQIPQPKNIAMYNKFMGGVDKADQYRSYYSLRMKSRKFYM